MVITSNRTREIHDAIKRRCYYHWVDYPDAARELEILRVRAPGTAEALSREVVAFVQGLREIDLFKAPGVAETIRLGAGPHVGSPTSLASFATATWTRRSSARARSCRRTGTEVVPASGTVWMRLNRECVPPGLRIRAR